MQREMMTTTAERVGGPSAEVSGMTPATAPSVRPGRRRTGQTVVASIAIALVVLAKGGLR
jgi:hypothetical protein